MEFINEKRINDILRNPALKKEDYQKTVIEKAKLKKGISVEEWIIIAFI